MRLLVQFAGSLAATLVQTAQPALIQASSFVLNPINVFIQVSNVMVILNVTLVKTRILMDAKENISKTGLFQNMPPSDVRA